MNCPQCNTGQLEYSKEHLVCSGPDCDFNEEIKPVIFNEKEDYFDQKGNENANLCKR